MKASTSSPTVSVAWALPSFNQETERTRRRALRVMAVVYAAFWFALAIAPRYRQDWALENALVVLFAALLFHYRKRVPLSVPANWMIFGFLVLHAVGAHYTYSEVPIRDWMHTMGLPTTLVERNHYDRFVHFSYGILLATPVRELCLRLTPLSTRLSYLLPVLLLTSCSAFYEWVEWGAAVLFGGDLGIAYVGSQGDPWDAQKDTLLASSGAVVVMLTGYLFQRRNEASSQ